MANSFCVDQKRIPEQKLVIEEKFRAVSNTFQQCKYEREKKR